MLWLVSPQRRTAKMRAAPVSVVTAAAIWLGHHGVVAAPRASSGPLSTSSVGRVGHIEEAAAAQTRRAEAAAAALAAGARELQEAEPPEPEEDSRSRDECLRRLRRTDFQEKDFNSGWMTSKNMSAFVKCLYQLRTKLRPKKKTVHAGGIHYPTLLSVNHVSPPVSTAAAQWCWLDERGVGGNGLTPEVCCDQSVSPRGVEACWDAHFTFELCCQGDVSRGELPHFFVAPAFDINVGNSIRQLGTFDIGQSYALQALCRSGDLVLDIGANVGGFTVPLAERVGPDGEVHAFEPFRKVFQHLNANVALNGLTNVFTHNVALGSSQKLVEVHTPDLTTWNFPSAMRVEEQYAPEVAAKEANLRYEKKRQRLDVRPLDSFEFDSPVRLVKIDVEFMELEVMRGAVQTFRRDHPVMWVENEPFFDTPSDRSFVNFMKQELGYECRPIARLELLCVFGKYDEGQGRLPPGFHRIFKHLTGAISDLRLWEALHEVELPAGSSKPS